MHFTSTKDVVQIFFGYLALVALKLSNDLVKLL